CAADCDAIKVPNSSESQVSSAVQKMNKCLDTTFSIPMKSIEIAFLIALLALFTSCSSERSSTSERPDKDSRTKESKTTVQTDAQSGSVNDSQCDKSIWDHVYDPSRLEV